MLIVGLIMAVYGLAVLAYALGRYTRLGDSMYVRWLNLTRPLRWSNNRRR